MKIRIIKATKDDWYYPLIGGTFNVTLQTWPNDRPNCYKYSKNGISFYIDWNDAELISE